MELRTLHEDSVADHNHKNKLHEEDCEHLNLEIKGLNDTVHEHESTIVSHVDKI